MFLKKIFSAVFRAPVSPRSDPAPAPYAGPRQRGFVAFVADVEAPHFLTAGERIDAAQASLRLRVWLPALELLRFAPVCVLPVSHVERDPQLAELGEVRAIVIGKFPVQSITREPARFIALIEWVRNMSARHRIVADLSDDLSAAAAMYERPEPAEFQRGLARVCALTVPTSALRDRLAADAVHGVTVIEDPYEREAPDAPRFAPAEVLRLAWFGVFGPPLKPMLVKHFSAIAQRLAPRAVEIAFITHAAQVALARQLGDSLRQVHGNCVLRFVPWSRDAVAAELARTDFVLLPQDAASDWGRMKSHNRMVEALRAGRFAIASPVPSYMELRDYAWVGENLADGVEWALAHADEVRARIHAGQAAVAERFSPQRIGELWAVVLGLLPQPRAESAAPRPSVG